MKKLFVVAILFLSVVTTASALEKVTVHQDHDVYRVKFAKITEDDGALVATGKDMTGYEVEMFSARSDIVISKAIIGPDGTAEFINNGPREPRERFFYCVSGKRWAIPCDGPFKITQSKGLGVVNKSMQINERWHGDEFIRTGDSTQTVKPVPDGAPWYQMDSQFFTKPGRKVKIVPGTVTVDVICPGDSASVSVPVYAVPAKAPESVVLSPQVSVPASSTLTSTSASKKVDLDTWCKEHCPKTAQPAVGKGAKGRKGGKKKIPPKSASPTTKDENCLDCN